MSQIHDVNLIEMKNSEEFFKEFSLPSKRS